MNLMDLYASLSLDTSNYDAGIASAKPSTRALGVLGNAAGKLIADAFEAAAKAIAKLAKNAVDVGSEFEYSMAKVSTIMDPSQMGITDMEDGILSLSQTMGIASTEIADTVYNVISATGDTAGALSIAESAAKLATAGFTDTGSAVSVLTTAMNAYGLSAEEVTNISDSMIMVQNLGVTTVGELSSTMGKAIASGAAYGVNLGNIETTYVALTKAGIGTAEATTYMGSMMKELGDSGSTVAKTLKKKTGKSFAELMAEGKSMGDVLEILNDSVKGDSAAFMGLWSSAEAGKAASAIAGQGFENFNTWLEQIESSAGATEEAYAKMANTFKTKTAILKQSANVVLAKIFERIAPALNNVVDGITQFIQSLDFNAIGDMISAVIEKVQGFLTKIDWKKFGRLATSAFSAIGTVIGWVYGRVVNFARAVIDKAIPVVNGLRSYFTSDQWNGIKTKFGEVWNGIRNAVTNAWETVKSKVSGVVESLKTYFASEDWQTIKTTVAGIWNGIRYWILNAWETVKTTVSGVVESLKAFFNSDEWQTIKTKVATVWNGIRYWILNAWETVKTNVSNALQSLRDYFSSEEWAATKLAVAQTWDAIRGSITSGWGGVITDMQGNTMTLQGYLSSSDFAFTVMMWSAAWDNIRSAVKRAWDWATQPFQNAIDTINGWLGGAKTNVETFHASVTQKFMFLGVALNTASVIMSGMVDKIIHAWDNFKTAASDTWNSIVTGIQTAWNTVKNFFASLGATLTSIWSTIVTSAENAWNSVRDAVTTGWNTAVSAVQGVFIEIHTKIVTAFNGIKTTVVTKINAIKTALSTVINKIKGFFDWSNWKISLPKLPTLKVTWESAGSGLFSGVQVPKFSWNARAMANPMILGDAMAFGMSGGQIEAGGEYGEEIVGGKNTIMAMIESAVQNVVGETLSAQMATVTEMLERYLPDCANSTVVLDTGAVVGGTVREMDVALGRIQARRKRGGY